MYISMYIYTYIYLHMQHCLQSNFFISELRGVLCGNRKNGAAEHVAAGEPLLLHGEVGTCPYNYIYIYMYTYVHVCTYMF